MALIQAPWPIRPRYSTARTGHRYQHEAGAVQGGVYPGWQGGPYTRVVPGPVYIEPGPVYTKASLIDMEPESIILV